ncbi:MAG: hypothetical protein RR593_04775, partial [Hungatella sp.]
MDDKKSRRMISIGIPSLILIFMVMCLSSLGLLTLKTTQSHWKLVQKNARAVQEYYEADSKGEMYLRQASEADRTLPDEIDIPVRANQVLRIRLEREDPRSLDYRIAAWQMINLDETEMN